MQQLGLPHPGKDHKEGLGLEVLPKEMVCRVLVARQPWGWQSSFLPLEVAVVVVRRMTRKQACLAWVFQEERQVEEGRVGGSHQVPYEPPGMVAPLAILGGQLP